jgi:hypothetical protein
MVQEHPRDHAFYGIRGQTGEPEAVGGFDGHPGGTIDCIIIHETENNV